VHPQPQDDDEREAYRSQVGRDIQNRDHEHEHVKVDAGAAPQVPSPVVIHGLALENAGDEKGYHHADVQRHQDPARIADDPIAAAQSQHEYLHRRLDRRHDGLIQHLHQPSPEVARCVVGRPGDICEVDADEVGFDDCGALLVSSLVFSIKSGLAQLPPPHVQKYDGTMDVREKT